MNKLVAISLSSALSGAASFQPLSASRASIRTLPKTTPQSSSSLQLGPSDVTDPSFLAGSALWGLNFYYGFDWLLAPLGTGLDSDFNPAYRTSTFVGSLLDGKSFGDALEASNGPITDQEGDRPEMGSRIGTGANVGYITDVTDEDSDWLKDREAGLRSSAPLVLQLGVLLFYGLVGVLVMGLTESLQTAGVLAIPALVYEIGRPSLPTREEAILDSKLDKAVESFVEQRVLVYGSEVEGVPPVKRDEATNERELVANFKRDLLQSKTNNLDLQDLSDFQIEMRFRELGTGRSEGGYIKGLRLLKEPIRKSTEAETVP